MKDFKKLMGMKGIWESDAWSQRECSYTFPNGSVIEFGGTQDEGRLHGQPQDILHLNEAMEIPYKSYQQLKQRTTDEVILDYNPSYSKHWVFDAVLSRVHHGEVMFVKSTWRDNPHLGKQQIDAIKSYEPTEANIMKGTADKYMWRVYGLGERGTLEGAIYSNWKVSDKQWPKPANVSWRMYGLDWGFAQDPTAMIECAWSNGRMHTRQLVYEAGLAFGRVDRGTRNTNTLEARLDALEERGMYDRDTPIVACHSRPELVDLYQRQGYRIMRARKVDVMSGISKVMRVSILVDEGSTDLRTEFEAYSWKKKGVADFVNEPLDRYNHLMDGLRYAIEEFVDSGIGRAEVRTEKEILFDSRVRRGAGLRAKSKTRAFR